MRRANGICLLFLAVAAVGVVVGRSVASPPRPPTREQVEADVGLTRIVADVNFTKTPLNDAIVSLRQQTAATTNLIVKWRVLEAAGVDANTPITLHVTQLPLRRVLELVCDEAGGGTVKLGALAQDGTIVLSTAEDNAAFAEMRLYDVRDLLQANYDFRVHLGWRPTTNPADASGGGPTLFASSGGAGNTAYPQQEAIDDLTRIITDFVGPDMWRENGGTVGTIREYNGRLMITATPQMHEEIASLLDLLRKGT